MGRWGEGKRESGGKGEGEIKTEKGNEVSINAVSSLFSGLFPTVTSVMSVRLPKQVLVYDDE